MLLAQANIALFRWPLDDHRMSAFSEQIQPINALAEQSAGFVWRFTEEYVARPIGPPWEDPLLFFNMSVWRDFDSLHRFVRCDAHTAIVRERSRWTKPAPGPPMVMWWIDDAIRPSVDDAILALSSVAQQGDSIAAFSFGSDFRVLGNWLRAGGLSLNGSDWGEPSDAPKDGASRCNNGDSTDGPR